MGNYSEHSSFNKTVQERLEKPVDLFLENDLSMKELSQNMCLNESARETENRYYLSWVNIFNWAVGQTGRDIC